MHPRHLVPSLIVATAAIFGAHTTVWAEARSDNEVSSTFELTNGPSWYRYGTGSDLDIVPAATDGFVDTVIAPDGQVELDPWIPGADAPDLVTVPWWDTDWQARQCASATGTGVQVVDVPFDSTAPGAWAANSWVQSDYGDLRAVVWDGVSAVTAPFWLATPFDTDDGHVFIEVDFGAASNRHICLYIGHTAGGLTSPSDPTLSQNWGPLRAVYQRVNPFASTNIAVANPTLAPVTIARDAVGTSSVTIPPGSAVTYALTTNTLFATGAVSVRGTNTTNADESLTPLFHQGTLFVSRTSRNVQQWCFAGATGTVVTVDPSNGPPVTFTHDQATPCRQVDTNRHTIITASAPVSVFHVTTNRRDPYVLYPATDDPLYGVPSNQLYIGGSQPGSVVLTNSANATSQTVNVTATGATHPGAGTLGAPPAFRITPTPPGLYAAIQQADSNGLDTTSLLPIEAMASRYVIPITANYVAIACPRPGEMIHVNGTPNTCTGVNVGYLRLGNTPAGSVIEARSGAAFTLYYHPGTDETNVFIPRFDWGVTEATPRPLESLVDTTGTWTAARTTVTVVWGLVNANTTQPAGTAIAWEFACAATTAGPFAFVPLTLGSAVPHACDDVDAVAVRATLSTTDGTRTPRIERGLIEHTLTAETPDVTLTYDLAVAGRTWLWRIHDPVTPVGVMTSVATTRTGVASGDFTVALVDNAMTVSPQVVATAPTASDIGGPAVPVQRSSLIADVTSPPAATDTLVWATTGTAGVERSIELR